MQRYVNVRLSLLLHFCSFSAPGCIKSAKRMRLRAIWQLSQHIRSNRPSAQISRGAAPKRTSPTSTTSPGTAAFIFSKVNSQPCFACSQGEAKEFNQVRENAGLWRNADVGISRPRTAGDGALSDAIDNEHPRHTRIDHVFNFAWTANPASQFKRKPTPSPTCYPHERGEWRVKSSATRGVGTKSDRAIDYAMMAKLLSIVKPELSARCLFRSNANECTVALLVKCACRTVLYLPYAQLVTCASICSSTFPSQGTNKRHMIDARLHEEIPTSNRKLTAAGNKISPNQLMSRSPAFPPASLRGCPETTCPRRAAEAYEARRPQRQYCSFSMVQQRGSRLRSCLGIHIPVHAVLMKGKFSPTALHSS